jgi:hypothetical protein
MERREPHGRQRFAFRGCPVQPFDQELKSGFRTAPARAIGKPRNDRGTNGAGQRRLLAACERQPHRSTVVRDRPQIHGGNAVETWRKNADDGDRILTDPDGGSDRLRDVRELLRRQLVAQDGHRRGAGAIVVRDDQPAGERRSSQCLEVAAADVSAACRHRRAVDIHHERAARSAPMATRPGISTGRLRYGTAE